ncbi:MAG: 4Fe-4S dicluster domain-containing protein [Planctomycetes bacterium]|nr:4Fe-4S dicluster domain-containing protein [Planctomycetota bacterium]
MGEPIQITIDGRAISTRESRTILDVALEHGIDIPNLCHDPRLKPAGACRLCIVEVEGQRAPVTACTFQVAPGQVVHTKTDLIQELRKTILELLFYEHRGVCTLCNKNGECKLQQYGYEYQLSEEVFQFSATAPNGDNYTAGNEALEYHVGKCIRCGRCVRICQEVQMDNALTFRERAASVEVSTAFGMPLNQSDCKLCGQCISTCPTGALYERGAHGKGQCTRLTKTRTTCVYCGVGCQIDLNVNGKNEIVRVTSPVGVVPNHGNLCVKGRFGMEFVHSDKRLTTPLIKRHGTFETATWDEAIGLVAARLQEIRSAFGPDSIGGLSSAKCTNEENYLFQKLIRAALGTNNVDHCARLCHASTVAGLAQAFGSGAMTNSIDEIRRAKCLFVIGSNTTEAHPVIALAIKEAVVRNGAKLIVADPRGIELVRFATLHLAQKPGTDVALLNAMMPVIVAEGLHDESFLRARTENFAALAEAIRDFTPEQAEAITTVPAEAIRRAARLYATAPAASIVYSMGITQHTTGTDNVLTLANLALLTGNLGKESAGVNPLRGQNNVQGACDMGALPNVYPGYQSVEDPVIRAKFQQAWGGALSERKGLTVVEMMRAVETDRQVVAPLVSAGGCVERDVGRPTSDVTRFATATGCRTSDVRRPTSRTSQPQPLPDPCPTIRALYIMGENPALSDPNLNRTRKPLAEVEFLVVQDIFLTETAEYADVVLPSTCFAEKDGTFTNTERRVQRVRRAVAAPGQARHDWEILCEVATKLGYPMAYPSPARILEEIASLTPIYGGISFERIETVGLQWPCPDRQHPGTKYLHADRFPRGKGKFHAVAFRDPAEMPGEEYPFVLSTGRQLYQFHTGTMTRKSRAIGQVSPTGYVEVHVEDARRLGIADGQTVEVATTRGTVTTPARVTTQIEKGWLFMPFHFHEGPANLLTQDALDPVAKIPEYKVCAARIRAVL